MFRPQRGTSIVFCCALAAIYPAASSAKPVIDLTCEMTLLRGQDSPSTMDFMAASVDVDDPGCTLKHAVSARKQATEPSTAPVFVKNPFLPDDDASGGNNRRGTPR